MENKHEHNHRDLQQNCIVKSIKEKGSKSILLLEPIKVQCPSCNGKCARMLKPSELIEYEYDKQNVEVGNIVCLSLDNMYLIKMVGLVFGVPLAVLLGTLLVVKLLGFSDYQQILTSLLMLVFVFALQARFIKFSKKLKLTKVE